MSIGSALLLLQPCLALRDWANFLLSDCDQFLFWLLSPSLLGFLLLVLEGMLPWFGVVMCGLCLGAGCALLWLVWFDRFAELDGRSIFFYVAICALVMAVFHIASTLLPEVQVPLLGLSIAGSLILLLRGFDKGAWKDTPSLAKGRGVELGNSSLSPRSVVLMVGVFAFSYHFAIQTVFQGTNDLNKDSEDVISACVMLAVFFVAKRCNFVSVLRVTLPLIIALYVMIELIPTPARPAGIVVAGSASKLIQLFLMAELIHMGSAFQMKRRWAILSLGVVAIFSGRLLSDLCVRAMGAAALPISSESLTIYVLLAILLLTMLVSLTSRPVAENGLEVTSPAGATGPESGIAESVANVAEEYGLTAREGDVLVLLAQGRTRSVIAKRLCISEGTVHAHMSHIYAKMGIHSQQELIDLVESKTPVQ